MDYFTAKTFQIPELKGISAKNIEEHMKLYAGYVKFANYIQTKIKELGADAEKNAYEIAELQRRFAFEHDGMKNHEIYFSQFEGGLMAITAGGALMAQIEQDFGSYDAFLARLKALAMTRGVGWAMLYYCSETGHLLTQWVDEQHLGHLNGPKCILAIDMWEHSFVFDYQPSGKKQYVEDFFANLNWSKVEERFGK
jgi:Fe-Mn family superoxide dismutase